MRNGDLGLQVTVHDSFIDPHLCVALFCTGIESSRHASPVHRYIRVLHETFHELCHILHEKEDSGSLLTTVFKPLGELFSSALLLLSSTVARIPSPL